MSDGSQTTKLTATWALGSPQKGQTYILKQGDDYCESRVSYFVKLDGLDITVGHPPSVPEDIKTAVGRRLQAREVRLCFGCHTTASMTSGTVLPDKALPGVTCGACHGPGAKHVESIEVKPASRRFALTRRKERTPRSSGRQAGFLAMWLKRRTQ